MIATFDTPKIGGQSGNYNAILWVAVLGIGGFLVWKYMIKPAMDKKKEEAKSEQ